jgi:hypothetical protein
MVFSVTESAPRDSSRRPHAKARAMGRRADRRDKSARRFLCIAFPGEFGEG